MAHAELAPSAAERWMNCTRSVSYCRENTFESRPSKYSDEGTLAHKWAEYALDLGVSLVGGSVMKETVPDPFGGPDRETETLCESDMAKHVMVYVDAIRERAQQFSFAAYEVSAPLTRLTGEVGAHGTADAVFYDVRTGALEVHDLKYGKGVRVKAANNAQLMVYALGVIDWLADVFGEPPTINSITLGIHQPRIVAEPQLWAVAPRDLRAFGLLVQDAARKVNSGGGFSPGAHCRFCPASGACPAQMAQNIEAVAHKPTEAADVASAFARADLIESWLERVKERARALAESGDLPGFKLVKHANGRRSWSDPAAVVAALDTAGAAALAPRAPAGVAEVMKALSSAQREALALFINESAPSLSVVLDDDPRDPYTVLGFSPVPAVPASK